MLNEEEADDLLYCSRAGELEDMQQMIEAILIRAGKDESDTAAFNALMKEVASKNEGKNTLLHFAAANGHNDLLTQLVIRSDLSVMLLQNESGNTALHWASLNGHLDAVKILIKRFGVVEANHKSNGLEQVASEHSEADEEREAQKRSVWDVVNQAGMGPMSTAQVNGRDNVVSFLLEHMIHGATNVSEEQKDGEKTPAESATQNGSDAKIEEQARKMTISQDQ